MSGKGTGQACVLVDGEVGVCGVGEEVDGEWGWRLVGWTCWLWWFGWWGAEEGG